MSTGTGVSSLPRHRPQQRGGSVELELGGRLTNCVVGYECIGPPGGPAVVVLGGISADAHVCSRDSDPRPGWWDGFVGPRCSIDTEHYHVIGMDWLGGPGATTGDPRPSRRLPSITPSDQATLLSALLDALGVERLHAIVGASYGGMAALAFEEPAALALARQLAMTTYRSEAEFHARFGITPRWEGGHSRFPVEDYLRHMGRSFVGRFTAEQYLRLSESLDLHRVDPARIRVPITLVSVQEDTLVPAWQMEELRARLRGLGELIRLESRYGHDAFLKERTAIGAVLQSVLGEDANGGEVVR